jgi:glycosyltransferase involved in cell wall biosynthesis
MANPPLISICIPTYNGREHLKECLDSVRRQTFNDFEVVICDDQSSDGTLEHARCLAEGDERFRFISNPCRFGLVGNWNNCIELSRGEWIKFVFQDDVIAPHCIEKLLHACQSSGKCFSFCARDFIFDDGASGESRNWFVGHKQRLQSDYELNPLIDAKSVARLMIHEPAHNLVGEPTATLANRSVFRELGKFDEALVHLCDAEFWGRVMINQGAIFVPETLAFFRIHTAATTARNHGKRAFRMGVLDPLVIRYRFAFGRHYGPVRSPQLTGKCILMLRLECASAAAHAWKQAGADDGSSGESSVDKVIEWKSVVAKCAGLQTLANVGRVINLSLGLKNRRPPASI